MKAKLIKAVEQKGSSNGAGRCYLLCFKGEDGKSYRSWTDERLGNFKRWYNAILAITTCDRHNEELWLDGLILKKGTNMIDADSMFTMKNMPKPFIPNHEEARPEISRKDTE